MQVRSPGLTDFRFNNIVARAPDLGLSVPDAPQRLKIACSGGGLVTDPSVADLRGNTQKGPEIGCCPARRAMVRSMNSWSSISVSICAKVQPVARAVGRPRRTVLKMRPVP